MVPTIAVALSAHVLAAVYWGGSTISLARLRSTGSSLFPSQMAAALLAILSGGYMMHVAYGGSASPMAPLIGAGAVCALLALATQAIVVGRWIRRSRAGGETPSATGVVRAHQIAGVLLVVSTLTMTLARFV